MTTRLPVNLENLKKQAKSLLKSVRAGDQESLGRIAPYFSESDRLSFNETQLVIAREHGFDSWEKLRDSISEKPGAAEQEEWHVAFRILNTAVMKVFYDPDKKTLMVPWHKSRPANNHDVGERAVVYLTIVDEPEPYICSGKIVLSCKGVFHGGNSENPYGTLPLDRPGSIGCVVEFDDSKGSEKVQVAMKRYLQGLAATS